MKRKKQPFSIAQSGQNGVVIGSEIFTVAVHFTKDGRGAVLIVADLAEGDRNVVALRQQPGGEIASIPNVDGLKILDVEHRLLVELWEEWQGKDSNQKTTFM